ncbi:right-handed parallel beta-helix repeat-containing protein [Winogradskyella sp. PG-2]|uniref:right-handed parallel beta-helix repeat-containing protein n=1 Tax=Winogradskyella sp. PG-2 TaxID=754409 RepID=UPI00045865BE|nr:right-handed parallel beta-helix repeat-containing protein [Winogradskyella sp. PG-2]BAO76642.1 hypothetical protein WPG_2412 [Winogradskyella sp. PG-2]
MRYLISLLILLFSMISFSQNEFHVFPNDGNIVQGTKTGDGSIDKPWDLQTALSQSSERVNGGDIIWIHEGVYTGSYRSELQSTILNKYITVSAYENEKVILNGNKGRKLNYVLEVNGSKVIYKNFEITYLGDFSRIKGEDNFIASTGINHRKGEDCKFQNLVIHNIPGSGIGSWKATGGTVIEDCTIYNNGYKGSRGHGVGIYIQNQSDKTRLIRNNIIYNNYYKGIEVWSATSGSKYEFVKNITLTDNIIFNNGSPSKKYVDNLIIASKDAEGINVAKDIKVINNILYHNVDFNDMKNYGYGSSLTLGYSSESPVENIFIDNNIIIGKNNALNISQAKSIVFKNNITYAGYIHFNTSVIEALKSGELDMNNNSYFTRPLSGFRVNKLKDYKLDQWQTEFNVERNSILSQLKDFDISPYIKVQRFNTNSNHFNVALLDKDGNNNIVDFSHCNVEEGMTFKIYDIENRTVIIKSGNISSDLKIRLPMNLNQLEMPLHNKDATKSANNFGVFRIEFTEKPKHKTFFGRLFGWLF